MMAFFAVIDTNIIISALLSSHDDAATVQVVAKMFSNELIPLYNNEILNEYHTVLKRKKFSFTPAIVDNMLSFITKCGINVNASLTNEILPDIKDLPFYEIAYEKQDIGAYLITGNIKHFPSKPFIVTANQFLSIILNKLP
jgi:putative PIN family toxin of toxin-antitoxin system